MSQIPQKNPKKLQTDYTDDVDWDKILEEIQQRKTTLIEFPKKKSLIKRLKDHMISLDDLKCGL